ncbi:adenylate/guanylate cyclase domain-containing protein [Microbacterium sp. MAH-37]|nr:tetratricopeptide repeat protein [Microbacterium sp. MAH-37]
MSRVSVTAPLDLRPYAPRLSAEWLAEGASERYRVASGTMVFADISGFTSLTERLARRGRVGAELLSDTLDLTFATLLEPAFADGADLLKWGGDAVLLLYRGADHAARAARASHRMRAALRELVRTAALPAPARLRLSIGIHSGCFDFFLVGDPASHRELIVAGPASTRLVAVEQACEAGQILLSAETAGLLPARVLGERVPDARLLRSRPEPAAPPPAAAPMTDAAPTLPPGILAHLRAGAAAPEHRPIAVAFVQFTGTDALLREKGPDAAASAVHDVVAAVQHACLDNGTTFFESDIAADGGKIMLTAGAPRSAGHDADRMLRTALAIAAHAGPLEVRVGLNTGHVFSGELGPAVRRTYSIKGDAVNLAARLLGRAAAGQVVATRHAARETRAEVRGDELQPFLVKGKRDPVQALVVREVHGGWSAGRGETRFLAREEELATLAAALDGAAAGQGAVLDVVGEPGIGKSRLVAEVTVPAGMSVLVTTAGGYDTGTPYAAAGSLLRSVLGIGTHESVEQATARLVQAVQTDAPELAPWLPLLGAPLDLSLPMTREVEELDERFRRGRIEEAAVALIGALLPRPTLLIFEDAHLMDEASGALLQRLGEEARRRAWCMLVTRREVPIGFVPSLDGPVDRRIALAAMPTEAAIELLASAAGDARPGRSALEAMAERARGNPLFLTALAAGGTADELPDSVEAVLLVDIDRLSADDRTLLRLAAVLGARFDPGILSEMHAVRADEIVGRLEEFLRPADGGELEFRHAMVRDVAYAGLPYRMRREMHERVALTLEQSAPADLLSMHFHAAGLHEKAWPYSLRAGEEARAKYAYAQAAAFFARALDSATHLPTPPSERSAANASLGECLDMAGDAAGALAALRRARHDLASDPVPTAELLYKEARITLRLGRYRPALAQLTRALRMLEGTAGAAADAVRATLATRYGFCLHLQRRSAGAVQWGRQGVAWAEASGDRTVLAHACNALHLAYGASEEAEDRPYGQLALALYEQLDDLSGQALTLNNLAIDAYNSGEWGQAVEGFGRAAESFHRLGDDANEATALYNRADVLVAQGRHDEALPVLRAALRLAQRVDDEELVGLVFREQARAAAGTGDRDGAWELFDQARGVLAGLDLATEVALLDAARAEALADAGDVAAALSLIDETITAAQAKATETLARLHRIRAQALVRQGQVVQAADAAREGLARTTGTYGGYEPALLGLTLADATSDEELGAESRRVLAGLGVVSLGS